jgi:hypothetical protein
MRLHFMQVFSSPPNYRTCHLRGGVEGQNDTNSRVCTRAVEIGGIRIVERGIWGTDLVFSQLFEVGIDGVNVVPLVIFVIQNRDLGSGPTGLTGSGLGYGDTLETGEAGYWKLGVSFKGTVSR